MLKNQLGKIIKYERNKAGLSAEKLCHGLCSATFLFRVERGERNCEKVLADALLQRLGVASERFVYLMNPDEQEWLLAREQLIQVVDAGDKESAQTVIEEYKRVTTGKSKLHRQFLLLAEAVLEWKIGCETSKISEKLQRAYFISVSDTKCEEIENRRLSLTEICIVTMLARIAEEQGEINKAERIYSAVIKNLNRFAARQGTVKLHSQVTYRLLRLLKKRGEMQRALECATEEIKLLKQCANITYMGLLLEEYTCLIKLVYGDAISLELQKEIAQSEKICRNLQWLYAQYQVVEAPWEWNVSFGMGEIELSHEVIRRRRKILGMSQEQLAEDICDPVTISRIECGKVKPKTNVLKEIMKKIDMAGDSFMSWYQVNTPRLLESANRITDYLATGNAQKAEQLLDAFEESMDLDNIFVKQYFLYTKALTLLKLGKINKEEHWKEQERALYLTLPKIPLEKLRGWVFSSQEIEIINALSYSCETVGKQDMIVQLLKIIMQSYEEKVFSADYYAAGIGLTARNLGNILGNMDRCEEALSVADYGIYWTLRRGTGAVLGALLYDRGWDMEQLWSGNEYTKEESLPYIEASLTLNMLMENKEKETFVRKHIERWYGM